MKKPARKQCVLLLCGFLMLWVMTVTAFGSNDATADYLIQTVSEPTVASIGGEWAIIGLARSGATVPSGYYDGYYRRLCERLKQSNGVLHTRKNTEYARVILALGAVGKNPESVGGYNLVEPLYDVEKTASQGLNGTIWALIALDSGRYGDAALRERYLSALLKAEKSGGGFALSEKEVSADVDITAMALTALSPYRDRADVSETIERALSYLSSVQNDDGTFTAYGAESSESVAQVLTALSSLNIAANDSRFCKNNRDLRQVLLSFRCDDGSFRHTEKSNLMATEQAYYALCAADRLANGETALFDMNKRPTPNPDVNVPPVRYAAAGFSDVTRYKTEIEALASRGIVNGVGENQFLPNRSLSRSEFCAVTVRALGLSARSDKHFADVSPNAWYESAVRTAYRYGIIGGVSNTHFSPDGKITFEQACAMLSRMSTLCGEQNTLRDEETNTALSAYSDGNKTANWARRDVAFCLKRGIFVRSETLSPSAPVTRGELCAAVYRLLKGAFLI